MKLTLIIPVYNGEQFIQTTLDNVFNQTLQPDEVLVINDGSSDQTEHKINEWNDQKKWNNLVLINQENQGAGAARNTGILRATGDIISFLDADDRLEPNHFEQAQRFFINHPDINWYSTTAYSIVNDYKEYCAPLRITLKRSKADPDFFTTNYFFSSIFYRYFVNTDTVFIRKEALNKAGLMENSLKVGEDQDLWFRIALKNPVIGYSPNATACYMRKANPNSLMNAISRQENRKHQTSCINRWLRQIDAISPPPARRLIMIAFTARWKCDTSKLDRSISKQTRTFYKLLTKTDLFFRIYTKIRLNLFLKKQP